MNEKKIYDCLIIGAGPAGMTSAIYAKRANLDVAIIEKSAPGGAVVNTSVIENYPGFISIGGADLAIQMFEQVMNLGVEYIGEEVIKINKDEIFTIVTDQSTYFSKNVILATGTSHKKLNIPNEERLSGAGISWCAICDGTLYKGLDVAVIGGGNSALKEANYLANIVNKVYLIHRRDGFRADSILIEKTKNNPKIEMLLNYIPLEFIGNENLEGIKLQNVKNNEQILCNVSGCFEFVGMTSNSDLVKDLQIVNEHGYVIVDKDCETKVKGLFACGDICDKNVRQIATAINDGAIAAVKVSKYCE